MRFVGAHKMSVFKSTNLQRQQTELHLNKLETFGNNNGIPKPRIIGGNGTKDDPYVLDGKSDKEDFDYLQSLANKDKVDIYFGYPKMKGSDGEPYLQGGLRTGRVTPD